MTKKTRILILEPYFGGSHRLFLNGLKKHLDCEEVFMTLPARKWKMRMQLSAPWFVEKLKEFSLEERFFDTVLLSTFVDVAFFTSLTKTIDGWNSECRICTYFHENQFAYPGQINDPGMFQFTAINFTTAMASDALAFNSKYNLKTFIKGVEKLLNKSTDMKLVSAVDEIINKSEIIYPGLDFSLIDNELNNKNEISSIPVIIWNHRWEHDKNPEVFFDTLCEIKKKKIPFRLIVLGQSFERQPKCFSVAEKKLSDNIIHFGYVDSKEQYAKFLSLGDIVVSTALHEFFGIAVIEAVRAGCRPLLPKRLSYPELFNPEYLYEDGQFQEKLIALLKLNSRIDMQESFYITEKFNWQNLKFDYSKWLKL